jgi:NADH-quinone oxidoreductase subunit M
VLGIFSFTSISFQGAIFQMISHGVSTGALFLGLGMIYDRRHTYEIKEFGGLVNPMPVLMSFFLFVCLSSLALPPLNGFIGEFLILIGVFQYHHAWASWAASGAVLSAIYLLWSYQRVALGEVTNDKNRTLPDASGRERLILVTVALAILFMGVASPLFTHRMQASTDRLVQQSLGHAENATTRPQPPPALAAGRTRILTQPLPQPLHDGSLASIAAPTVQP